VYSTNFQADSKREAPGCTERAKPNQGVISAADNQSQITFEIADGQFRANNQYVHRLTQLIPLPETKRVQRTGKETLSVKPSHPQSSHIYISIPAHPRGRSSTA
jgi:hypothetical protein